MYARLWLALGAEFLVFAVLLFGGAGSVWWSAGWVFLILFFGAAVLVSLTIARRDPALMEERLKPLVQEGQPVWDKILITSIAVVFCLWLVVMGIDAVRYRWSAVPFGLQVVGAVGVELGFWIAALALRENTFSANVVRLQDERNQTVISSGPYAIVRHPLYAGALLMFPSTALLLGSWWGLVGAVVLTAGLVVRTSLEDRELQRALPGYREYAVRVHYRLVPLIW